MQWAAPRPRVPGVAGRGRDPEVSIIPPPTVNHLAGRHEQFSGRRVHERNQRPG